MRDFIIKREKINLNKIIDFEKWQAIQDNISLVTNMAVITVDYKGNPISKHSKCSKFCEAVRNNNEMSKYCQKCDSRGGLEAARSNEPYIYLCHYNIVDVAVPIIVDDNYMGAIMAGQIKLIDDEAKNMEKILDTSDKMLANKVLEEFKEYYNEIPKLTYGQVQNIANMISSLCNYLVEEALDKNLILEVYKKSIEGNVELEENFFDGYSINNIESIKRGISNALINAYISEDNEIDNNKKISRTLRPAIKYIYMNKSENITLENMAKVCHISSSYFSRLFSKEMGESFSNYISKLKIKWAKELLEQSDKSINEISEELGFNDSGYFIKIFKKYEGVTPFIYRKYYKSN